MTDTNGTPFAEPTNGAANGTNPTAGTIRNADLITEMQTAYLDYAMSVIVARALPDVRDGLKPVHRRILYAMWHDLGLTFDKPHKKSARIVGEVLGKYHPHGDSAVYDAMVRMAQDFSLRCPLIDGQGNFGSIDGDNAAAMRYTEARLARIANLVLEDLDKDTVSWHDNFDNTLREPDVLPAALPNLLVNGSSGIAVGMATNIPPHNLGEVVDALIFLIDRFDKVEEITTEELMQFIKGPDFPTGGIVYRFREGGKDEDDVDAIAQGYSLGKSRLIIQAKAHFEEISRGRTRIIVTELPYMTNKVALLERIADLVRDGKLEGITDLRDESDRTGMRVVVELARTVEPKDILADLYKYTPLQQTFGMQLLALVDGQPRLLSLKRMLQLFVQHRQVIVRKRSQFDLARARERAHIVEGLLRALDILDEVIQTIRRSQTVDSARKNLVANFQFSHVQAQAILDMQLRRLAALERKRLQEEFDELKQRIAYLEDLLAHPHKILGVIKEELLAIRRDYADARRTQIVDRTRGALTTHDLLPDQEVWVSLGRHGDLRRQAAAKPTAAVLRQIGKDSQTALLSANTRDVLYVFSADGRCARIGIHEIPEDGTTKHVAELSGFDAKQAIAAALALPRERLNGDGGFLFLATEKGAVKRVAVADVQANTAPEFAVINVETGDRLGWVFPTLGGREVILVTAEGQSIRFGEEEVRSMGLPAGGVGGIKLKGKDHLVYAGLVEPTGELVTITALGFAKRSALGEYSPQGRNGGGIVAHKLGSRSGPVTAALVLPPDSRREALVAVTAKGVVKTLTVGEVPAMSRSALGKQVLTPAEKDTVARIWRAAGGEGAPEPTPPERRGRTSVAEVASPSQPAEASPRSRPPGKPAQPTAEKKETARVAPAPVEIQQPGPKTQPQVESAGARPHSPPEAKKRPAQTKVDRSVKTTGGGGTGGSHPPAGQPQPQAQPNVKFPKITAPTGERSAPAAKAAPPEPVPTGKQGHVEKAKPPAVPPKAQTAAEEKAAKKESTAASRAKTAEEPEPRGHEPAPAPAKTGKTSGTKTSGAGFAAGGDTPKSPQPASSAKPPHPTVASIPPVEPQITTEPAPLQPSLLDALPHADLPGKPRGKAAKLQAVASVTPTQAKGAKKPS
jgi:DNA gyrase subunit A